MRRPRDWAVAILLTIIVIVGGIVLVAWRATQVEIRYPVETTVVTVAHETTTVPVPTLPRGQRLVRVPGQDGVLRTFTYFEETWAGGQLRERRQIATGGRPTSQWVTKPIAEVDEVGAGTQSVFQLAADNERGLTIGKTGASGAFSFRITGTVTFAGATTVSGPLGNPRYKYYQKPIVRSVPPGCALIRVGNGAWRPLAGLAVQGGVYTIRGRAGESVRMLVNDAPGFYGDNRGSFAVTAVAVR